MRGLATETEDLQTKEGRKGLGKVRLIQPRRQRTKAFFQTDDVF
jgi:hypothetical protein